MAKQTVNIGTSANKGNGDPLRTAFTKINNNFDELYSALGSDGDLFDPNSVDQSLVPTTTNTVDLGSASKQWRSLYVSNNTSISGTLSTADITTTGSHTVSGNVTVAGEVRTDKIKSPATNADIVIEPQGTGQIAMNGPVKFNVGYIDDINTLTSSSTITVDCNLAPVHKVTLTGNTAFVISNLPTGGTVTLIIRQDATGLRTATFGTDGSTAVKFPSGAATLSTAANAIDVVAIFNDGTVYLGNIANDYS